MSRQSKAEIIRALFAAYLSNDRKAVEDAFGDDFHFTSPYDDKIDKATFDQFRREFVSNYETRDNDLSNL